MVVVDYSQHVVRLVVRVAAAIVHAPDMLEIKPAQLDALLRGWVRAAPCESQESIGVG